jgi:hypothetical protein
VNVALFVLERTVLDARVELWDVDALEALSAKGLWVRADSSVDAGGERDGKAPDSGLREGNGDSTRVKRPRTEVRVCVGEEQLAVADAAVHTLTAALPSDCLCISVVAGESHNLTGPFLPLKYGAAVRVKEMLQPATHPDFPRIFEAFIESSSGGTASAPPGGSVAVSPPEGGAASGVALSVTVSSIGGVA